MNKVLLSILCLFMCVSSAFAHGGYAEGEVIAELAAPAADNGVMSVKSYAASSGLTALHTYSGISEISGNIVHLRSETKSTEQLMRELALDPRVISVQPNYIRYVSRTPDDARYGDLWAMTNIRMPEVWDRVTGSESVCVAVLDSGIDYNHEDLQNNMAVDSYGNHGRKFFDEGWENGEPMDTFGHGTHVAGTIGAVGNNGIGITGVNWNVKLLAVNVLPNGTGYDSDIIKGIEYIISEKRKGLNIRVVSMALGGWEEPLPDTAPLGRYLRMLSDAGVICVIAAGNESQNIYAPEGIYEGELPYPASFRFANTITVGSVGPDNTKSSFSNHGSAWVHIAAPGGQGSSGIYSTLPTEDGGYGYMTGTSMATSYVAGVAAVLSAAFPYESPAQIKNRILEGARNEGVREGYWENGVLDAMGAYEYGSSNNGEESDDYKPTGGGGGGGCSAGFGYIAIILMTVPFVLTRKK